MPRRRKLTQAIGPAIVNTLGQVLGYAHPVASSALTVAQHGRTTQGGHYGYIGAPLTNYKQARVNIPKVTNRRTKDYSKINLSTTSKAMPYRPKRPAFGRRKRYGRRRGRRLMAVNIPRQKLVKFKVVHSGSLSGAGGALNAYVFKANSLEDPTGTMGAGLPLGLDQWSAFYNKYIVVGSKIVIRAHPTTSTGASVIGLHLSKESSTLTDHDYYKELPMTKQRIVSPDIDLATLKMGYSGKRFWKVKNLKDDSEQEGVLSTTPGAPTDTAFWHLYIQDLNKTDNTTIEFQVEITYICLLTEPVTPARSSL